MSNKQTVLGTAGPRFESSCPDHQPQHFPIFDLTSAGDGYSAALVGVSADLAASAGAGFGSGLSCFFDHEM